ncbi:MAG: 4-hydroxythreonine-4-phosphate dehydrogenase PdxA [Halioglobus sp.]
MIPRIAITAGEPAGIGPDIALAMAGELHDAELVVIAAPELLRERAGLLGLDLQLREVDLTAPPRQHEPGRLLVDPVPLAVTSLPGRPDPANAPYVLDTLRRAVDGCLAGRYSAMVTAPVQKSVINEAGIPFSGHTEFLAEATATPRVVMMLASGPMRVALATTHLPLAAVPGAITPALLEETLTILHRDLREKFGLPAPRIAVLGLNPHAGEGGHMGREEIDTLIPTLTVLRANGMDLLGPLPADTAFNRKVLDQVDAIFAMYHDQGLPVLKYASFGHAVNITLGLPIVRTSVDHGTALDLAGSGRADTGSMGAALEVAIELGLRRPASPGEGFAEPTG